MLGPVAPASATPTDTIRPGLERAPAVPGPAGPAELLRRIAAELGPAAAASRKVLLGARDPNGPSCVRPRGAGDVHGRVLSVPMDPHGGPGTRFVALCQVTHRTAAEGQRWEQTALRGWLRRMRRDSRSASLRMQAVAGKARALAAQLRSRGTWPQALSPVAVGNGGHWPGACLASLNQAVGARDLPAARRWADELGAATFALADLHRWLELLTANHLAALDFQGHCAELAPWVDRMYRTYGERYDSRASEDRFPSSAVIGPMTGNLFEIERQAEGLFRRPEAHARAAAKDVSAAPAAVWMPPDLRGCFVALRRRLSAANRRAWDAAAAAPLDRSYLANMLFRASRAKAVDQLGAVLARFDRSHPRAERSDLMDVIFYRGGTCGGLDWGDRYDRRLLGAAGRMGGSDEAVLRRAHRLTHNLFGGWDNYRGHVRTLREALDTRKLDCVRGTDMIGALYRNAGRSRYACVHLSCGLTSHNVGAAETTRDGRRAVLLADSLAAPNGTPAWPGAYFRGFTWPKGYRGCTAPPFAAELYVRGLDNYVFAEGYVVRGRDAGLLVRAAVPYLPGRERPSAAKVHPGPYPSVPGLGRKVAARHAPVRKG